MICPRSEWHLLTRVILWQKVDVSFSGSVKQSPFEISTQTTNYSTVDLFRDIITWLIRRRFLWSWIRWSLSSQTQLFRVLGSPQVFFTITLLKGLPLTSFLGFYQIYSSTGYTPMFAFGSELEVPVSEASILSHYIGIRSYKIFGLGRLHDGTFQTVINDFTISLKHLRSGTSTIGN